MMTTNWKKGIALLLAVLLLGMSLAACRGNDGGDDGDVMIRVEGGRPVLWDELYYDIQIVRHNLEMWGPIADWDAMFHHNPLGEEMTYREFILLSAIDTAMNRRAIEALFSESGETLDENAAAEVRAGYLEEFEMDEEEFAELLEQNYLTEEVFRYATEVRLMADLLVEVLFGVDGADITSADIAAVESEADILRAKHILIQVPAEEDDPEATEQIWAIYEQLSGLTGDALAVRFDELIDTYGEDPGMLANPDGYTFVPGVMVPEFTEGAQALEMGTISEPIRAFHGYHIILRLPVQEDAIVMMQGGMQMPFRQLAITTLLDLRLEERRAEMDYTLTQALMDFNLDTILISEE